MVFSSTIFLFGFLPIVLGVYFLLQEKYRNYWLLIVSLLFFMWSQPAYGWLIIVSIIINYVSALFMSIEVNLVRNIALWTSVCLNIGLLFYYKYYDFSIQTINRLFSTSLELKNIILPIGISFFTFQGLSYVVDVYRKEVPVQKSPFKVGLYIVLFPQLIAGPIVRYKSIAKEIDYRSIDLMGFVSGVERFILGLGKKVVFSNTLAVTVDTIWNQGAGNSTMAVAWLGSIAYALQIYFDFSGYSDMAIGLGRMFGFHFEENFNYPYVSKSISEFWRRWHISLSSWFRDYVYIPLGGKRKHLYRNLVIVFLLTGIWHGAAWHFIAWGVWHGIFRLIERVISNRKNSESKRSKESYIKDVISWIYTMLVVNFGWVLFRANTMTDAKNYILNMLGINSSNITPIYSIEWYMDKWTVFILLLSIIVALDIPSRLWNAVNQKIKMNSIVVIMYKYIGLILIFIFSVMRVVVGTYNPFIYFQF